MFDSVTIDCRFQKSSAIVRNFPSLWFAFLHGVLIGMVLCSLNRFVRSWIKNYVFLFQTESETSCEEAARLTADGAADADDDEEYFGELPPPPDGGYGWVVVFASFMCNLVVDGIAYTFGIFLPELVKYFGEGKGTVAWVGSLLSGVYLAAGELNLLVF